MIVCLPSRKEGVHYPFFLKALTEANLCMGSGCPILAYSTNFFETFNKEVIKYSGLGEALVDVFKEREKIKMTLRTAEEYVNRNSSHEIAKRFIDLFESLLEITEHRAMA